MKREEIEYCINDAKEKAIAAIISFPVHIIFPEINHLLRINERNKTVKSIKSKMESRTILVLFFIPTP